MRTLLGDDRAVDRLIADGPSAAPEPADQVMLEFARHLTLHVQNLRKVDVDRLREAGFDDDRILDIVQVTAYFNFVNRLAEGLGVELEE